MSEENNLNQQPYGQPAQPYGQPAQPYGQPAQPYGQPVQPAAPAPAKSKLPLILGIAGGAVLLIVAAIILISSLGKGSGTKEIAVTQKGVVRDAANAAEKTADAVKGVEAITQLTNLLHGGSISFTEDVSKLEDLIGASVKATVGGTLYFDLDGDRLVLDLLAQYKDKTLASGSAYLSKTDLVLKSAEILGDDALGVSLKNLTKNLPKSVFGPDGDMALPEEAYEAIMKYWDSAEKDAKGLYNDFVGVINEGLNVVAKSVQTNAAIETEKGVAVTIGETDVKTTETRVILDSKAIAAVAKDALEWASKSKTLKTFLDKLVKEYGEELEEYDVDIEEYVEDFYDEVEDLLDDVEDLEDELEDVTLTFRFNTDSKGRMVLLEGSVKVNKEKNSITLVFGPDASKPTYFSVTIAPANEDKMQAVLTVDEDTKTNFACTLKVKEGKETVATAKFTWDKKEGGFKLSVTDLLTVTGTMAKKSKVTTITVKKVSVEGYRGFEIKNLGLTIEINESAKVPSVPKYKDVLTFKSEDDFEDLMDKIEERVDELMEKVQEMKED